MARKKVGFEPFLAATKSLKPEEIDYSRPLLASYKMDGIRCLISPTIDADNTRDLVIPGERGGWRVRQGSFDEMELVGPFSTTPLTRSMKPIRNDHIRSHLSMLPAGLDGEVGLVDPDTGAVNFRATTSGVMNGKKKETPDFRFFVFDDFLHDGPYHERLDSAKRSLACDQLNLPDWAVIAEQRLVTNADDVREMYEEALQLGHEGLILRCPEGAYKNGRSTVNERIALKMKPWEDSEGTIVDFEFEYENTNEKERDERGYAKRSSAKDGKVARERIGVLILKDEARFPGQLIKVGSGMTHQEKQEFFTDWDETKGRLAKYKFMLAGGYDAPRHATFLGLRDPDDMS